MNGAEYDLIYAQRQLERSQHPLRKRIKQFYLNNLLRDVKGMAVDFGCGAGQLLAQLPTGSLGLEVNPHLVAALQAQGLIVKQYEPDKDQLNFLDIPKSQYQTFIMSHVLEHFENAADALRKLLQACARLKINRLILILPGEKGYGFDKTHRTFVNREFIRQNKLDHCEGFKVTKVSYFPVNAEIVGRYFVFHEMKIIYDKYC